jgi:hypothetical protein
VNEGNPKGVVGWLLDVVGSKDGLSDRSDGSLLTAVVGSKDGKLDGAVGSSLNTVGSLLADDGDNDGKSD